MTHTTLPGGIPARNTIRSTTAAALFLVAAALSPGMAGSQTYDPTEGSPLTLLSVPRDGVAYYEAKLRAAELVSEKQYAEAEPLVERLTREYPRDGENWILLARVKRGLDKPAEAAPAYERAGRLIGWGPYWIPGYSAAARYLEAGDRRAALDALRREVFEHRGVLRDEMYDFPGSSPWFASLRDDPEFLEIIGRPDTTGWTRDYGWRRDIDHLYGEVRRVNPDYHDEPFPAELDRRYEELKEKVPQLSDEEIFVGMSRMLAVLRQGHVSLFETGPGMKQLPLQLYAFPEGIFIVDASGEQAPLVGSRLLAIGGTPAEEALRRIAGMMSVDGDMQYVWTGLNWLVHAQVLKGLGVAGSVDSITVTVQPAGGRAREVALATVPATSWKKLVPPRGAAPPLFLRNVGEAHWEVALPEHDALYVQMNQASDDEDETLPAFGRRLWTVLSETGPKSLILDLRHNNGGATQLYPELLRSVIAFTRTPGNRLYVLIGRNTYSAAANLITDLERLADPVFVGEASSECCNFYGDPASVTLPYSGHQAELTAVRWNLSKEVFDARREMSPEVPVQLTAGAYFAGRDPALEAIFRMIESSRKEAGEGSRGKDL